MTTTTKTTKTDCDSKDQRSSYHTNIHIFQNVFEQPRPCCVPLSLVPRPLLFFFCHEKQACFDKWEENPEIVPEECMCAEDVPENPEETVKGGRFGEAQASLGLDRYSVGYDLPLPSFFEAVPVKEEEEVEIGGPVLETLADLPGQPQRQPLGGAGKGDPAASSPEAGRPSERNETSSSSATSSVPSR